MSNTGKQLTTLDAILIVSGSMIGSGIFLVSAEMSRYLGSAGWLLLAWVITGLFTLLGALTYGELAGMMPKAGGQYIYIQRAFGRLAGFVYGWTVFTVIQTGVIAAVAMAFANYLGQFVPELGNSDAALLLKVQLGEGLSWKLTNGNLVAISMVLFLTWMNSLGVQEGKWIQRIFTFAKLLALFGLILCGLYFATRFDFLKQNMAHAWDAATYPEATKGSVAFGWQPISGFGIATALGLAMIGSMFSSDAWNNVTFIAAEIKDPARNIPRSLLAGTLLVTIIYLLANVAYISLLPVRGSLVPGVSAQGISHALNDRVGSAAASMILGDKGAFLMAGLILISTFGCNNGLILSGARFYKAMADDGLFFKKAAELNARQVPGNALWIQGIWASVLCLSGTYSQLIGYCIFAALIFYVITASALLVLRKKEPDTPRPYKVFGYPLVPILFMAIAVFVGLDILYFKWLTALIGIGIAAIGIPVFYAIKKT